MNPENSHPGYVPRGEEEAISAEVARVRETGLSRALLVYGPGGIGKTSLVRNMVEVHREEPGTAWLEPVDADDPECWLLATLEQKVTRQLDPYGQYFGPYLRYLSRLPGYTRSRATRDQVISHLGRIKRVFVDCYEKYITETGTTVVMTFDTVEAMRGIYLVYTLTQWMKSLRHGTLFILSGRPAPLGDRSDPIQDELQDQHQHIPVTALPLGPFSYDAAFKYLSRSAIGSALAVSEIEKLVLLTRGHPLWLAFAVSHVSDLGLPAETTVSISTIRRAMPYAAELDREGQQLHEAFKRRLMAPYREVDFWHEAIKRLAVVRQGMSLPVWQRLMSDWPFPAGTQTSDDAWRVLRKMPWIRSRVNDQYVTLHDAVAEEIAQRVIPLHDSDQGWRRELWVRAAGIYGEMAQESAAELVAEQAQVDDLLSGLSDDLRGSTGEFPILSIDQLEAADDVSHGDIIAAVVHLDERSRQLDELRVTAFHYQLLSDFAMGADQFLLLFGQAQREYDVFLQDRLALEMQRFLPGTDYPYPLTDIISPVVAEFAAWLTTEARDRHLAIGMAVGGYLVDNQHPNTALVLLNGLPEEIADGMRRARLEVVKANANMRIPLGVQEAFSCLMRALEAARSVPERAQRRAAIADVYKELGFCNRNAGNWQDADHAYEQARDAIMENFSAPVPDSVHEDMASIQTNWAYLKGLIGEYRDGSSLAERAIETRHRLGLHVQEGISLSVRGEIFRYERRFEKAWESFGLAEQIFQGRRDWSWLGQIYQEQAICLLQAAEDGISLVPAEKDPVEQAKRLITLALDICRDQNVRAYPAALNRAGRIFGANDYRAGLKHLEEAAVEARRLSDGWFWIASLIEYAELGYRAWLATADPALRTAIAGKADDISAGIAEYHFADLEGRWLIVTANLALRDWLAEEDKALLDSALLDSALLDSALGGYAVGFRLLAQGQFGSSGASSIPPRFAHFRSMFAALPGGVQQRWLSELHGSWRNIGDGSTVLLACLEQLY
jgi:tetratricopeptide (TPR) repeat protein